MKIGKYEQKIRTWLDNKYNLFQTKLSNIKIGIKYIANMLYNRNSYYEAQNEIQQGFMKKYNEQEYTNFAQRLKDIAPDHKNLDNVTSMYVHKVYIAKLQDLLSEFKERQYLTEDQKAYLSNEIQNSLVPASSHLSKLEDAVTQETIVRQEQAIADVQLREDYTLVKQELTDAKNIITKLTQDKESHERIIKVQLEQEAQLKRELKDVRNNLELVTESMRKLQTEHERMIIQQKTLIREKEDRIDDLTKSTTGLSTKEKLILQEHEKQFKKIWDKQNDYLSEANLRLKKLMKLSVEITASAETIISSSQNIAIYMKQHEENAHRIVEAMKENNADKHKDNLHSQAEIEQYIQVQEERRAKSIRIITEHTKEFQDAQWDYLDFLQTHQHELSKMTTSPIPKENPNTFKETI